MEKEMQLMRVNEIRNWNISKDMEGKMQQNSEDNEGRIEDPIKDEIEATTEYLNTTCHCSRVVKPMKGAESFDEVASCMARDFRETAGIDDK